MSNFDEFFVRATGNPPYGFQRRLAENGLPQILHAATGTGKTSLVVAWLWRRLHGPDRDETPRRLIFALPQRTLVEQVASNVERWLANLGLTDEVPLHVVMGGAGHTQRQWRVDMHRPAVIVGTVDSLVSKALNRGYGISRAIYPIDFALVTNGAHWVIDEVQLCPESTTTLRQLAAFADQTRPKSWPTVEPFGLTCMSATVSERLLTTVDNPLPSTDAILRIEDHERVGPLARRLGAQRAIRQLDCAPGDAKGIAAAVRDTHRPGTLTLVVVNTVKMARDVYAALRDLPAERTLLHSRFRGLEREKLIDRVTNQPGEVDHVVISTQVVEAGVDLNATVLITEAAPWPSIVQRAGRCNRTGEVDDATLWWLAPSSHAPYEKEDIAATVAELTALNGQTLTGEDLLARPVQVTEARVSVLRRPDLLALFDTAPDLTGSDVDVAPYVRDADDLDVQLAWAQWTPSDPSGRPPAEARPPETRMRCRVPLGEIRSLAKAKNIWRLDQKIGGWSAVTERAPARPGEVLVIAAADGCYDPTSGFDPKSRKPVPDAPTIGDRPDSTTHADPASGAEDPFRGDDASLTQPQWLPLQHHSDDVRDAVETLIGDVAPNLPAPLRRAILVAAHAHDAGKSHPIWQDALCALATPDEQARVEAGKPWAKSARTGRLAFARGVNFRHELVSLLLLDGPLAKLLDEVDDPDLVRYLVLAHHGKLRLQVRGPDDTDPATLLGLTHGDVITWPGLLNQPAGEMTVDIGQFSFGGQRSWTRTALKLRNRYGPFQLAYMETLVRIADWRASAQPTPREETHA